MGVLLHEDTDRALRVAEVARHNQDVAAYEAAYLDDDRMPAEMLAAMLTNCVRSGALQTRLPVPGWRDTVSRKRGPASVLEIAAEEAGADDALMARLLQVVGRAMATDEQARAVVAEIAARYGKFHGVA